MLSPLRNPIHHLVQRQAGLPYTAHRKILRKGKVLHQLETPLMQVLVNQELKGQKCKETSTESPFPTLDVKRHASSCDSRTMGTNNGDSRSGKLKIVLYMEEIVGENWKALRNVRRNALSMMKGPV